MIEESMGCRAHDPALPGAPNRTEEGTVAAQVGLCIAEVRVFGFGFMPAGWLACDGRVLPITEHQPLFSVLGWRFGGDSHTTFALPVLREPAGAVVLGIGATGITLERCEHDT